MNYAIFDDYELLKSIKLGNSIKPSIEPLTEDFIDNPVKNSITKILINKKNETIDNDCLIDEIVAESFDTFGYRVFQFFTNQKIDDYDYTIYTEYPEQYESLIDLKKIIVFRDGKKISYNPKYIGTKDGVEYSFFDSAKGLKEYSTITQEYFNELLEGESEGKVIKFNGISKPTLEDYIPSQIEIDNQEILKLKQYLSETDYVVIKIAEGEASKEEYADILEKRKEARVKINEFEKDILEN